MGTGLDLLREQSSVSGQLLINAGKVSHQKAIEKAKLEYKKYRKAEDIKYISDFDREMKKVLGKDD